MEKDNKADGTDKNNSDVVKNMHDVLLAHLHEQYAVNNNANLSSMVTLVVGIVAVIGYYGYVFIYTVNDFGDCCGQFVQGEYFTMTTLLLIYFSTVCILAILMRLCIYQGIAQRKEQFIIEAIRKHYDKDEVIKNILPNNYTASGKNKQDAIQGLFGEFVKTFRTIIRYLTIVTLIRVVFTIFPMFCTCCENLMWSVLAIVTAFFVYVSCMNYWDKHYSSYREREIEYKLK